MRRTVLFVALLLMVGSILSLLSLPCPASAGPYAYWQVGVHSADMWFDIEVKYWGQNFPADESADVDNDWLYNPLTDRYYQDYPSDCWFDLVGW